ncbi:MAG: hypothetical protein H6735_11030 [Alphaproteobacteria bacterium]|nr:hypothetical protein [Alphaproteobacteria bacterium]
MRPFALLVLLAACADPAGPITPDDLTVVGTLPHGVDLDEVRGAIDDGGFAVVADPRTGEVATITADPSPLARVASAEFSVAAPASCPDCVDPTCASTARTVDITLTHDTGNATDVFFVSTSSATNFVSPSTAHDWFEAAPGTDVTLSTTGTLPSCAPFSWYFEVATNGGPLRSFTTSTTVLGDFGATGNATAADGICLQRAQAAGFGGAWRAWVRDDVEGLPQDRFVSDGPWVRLGDGALVALDLSDLSDGDLRNAVSFDEFGSPVAVQVWTGFSSFPFSATCSSWTSQGTGFLFGGHGLSDRTDGAWEANGVNTCLSNLHLYCFEQRQGA